VSNNWDSDDTDNEVQDSDLVRQLRKQLEQANKKLKALDDAKRGSALDAVLAKLPEKVRAKAKNLIGDTDPDEWFGEYGDLFGGNETPAPAAAEAPAVPAEDTQALQAISNALQGGETPDRDTRFAQQLEQVSSPDDITRLIFQTLSQGR
jgi:hypothetical protein